MSPHNPGAEALTQELTGVFGTPVGGHDGGRRRSTLGAPKRRSTLMGAGGRTTRVPLSAKSDADAFESAGAMLLLLNRPTD